MKKKFEFEFKAVETTYFSPVTESADRMAELLVKWINGEATEKEIAECKIRGEFLAVYLDL